MFRSLRSRLLISYIVIIATVLILVTLALLAISAAQTTRILPTLRQLGAVAQGTRRELARAIDQGEALPGLRLALEETAREQNTRILLINQSTGLIVFDSLTEGESWTGTRLENVVRPRGEFANLDPNLPVGRYRAPDGSSWLVYPQPAGERGGQRFLFLFAQPEPTVLQFFRQNFARPLFFAGLVAFILSILLAALIARSVTRPLKSLMAASESMAQGDYDQQISAGGPEEVKRVAVSFNVMAAQVAASQVAQRDFVTNVSHDLKTPLTSILGWSQALIDGTADESGEKRRAYGVIHNEATRMERMVAQLLDLARIESGQLTLAQETVDLRSLLGEVERSFSLAAQEKGVSMSLDVQDVHTVTGDADRLSMAIGNLVANALAHTPAGGTVHLGLRPYGLREVEILVQDSGEGIPPDELDRIFERFYQVDKSRSSRPEQRGSGLGLAIVKELIEAHHGRIEVQSQPGQGSAFIIHLPVDSAAT